mgnify:CR=1 FL=1
MPISYGLIMDNVTELRNLTAYSGGKRQFTIYPDPVFKPFVDGVKRYFPTKNDYLTIDVSIG